MPHTGVNAAAIGIQAADHDIVQTDQRGQDAHRGDEPERRVTRDGKRKADYVRFTRAPIAVQNRGGPFPIDIARPLNVCRYQLIFSLKRSDPRATRRLISSGVGFTTSLAL